MITEPYLVNKESRTTCARKRKAAAICSLARCPLCMLFSYILNNYESKNLLVSLSFRFKIILCKAWNFMYVRFDSRDSLTVSWVSTTEAKLNHFPPPHRRWYGKCAKKVKKGISYSNKHPFFRKNQSAIIYWTNCCLMCTWKKQQFESRKVIAFLIDGQDTMMGNLCG